MKYIVIKSHVSNYPDPIRLEEGDVVKMIESYDGPEKLGKLDVLSRREI